MSENSIKARLPRLPHPEFFRTAEHSILTADGSALLAYDPETRAGFIYSMTTGTWSITAPIAFPAFAVIVAGSVLSLAKAATMPMAASSVDEELLAMSNEFELSNGQSRLLVDHKQPEPYRICVKQSTGSCHCR